MLIHLPETVCGGFSRPIIVTFGKMVFSSFTNDSEVRVLYGDPMCFKWNI